jgi:hypothetical protein
VRQVSFLANLSCACVALALSPRVAAKEPAGSDDDLEFEGTAEVEAPPRDVTRRSVENQVVQNMPGTRGDALRAIEIMPGVARTSLGRGDPILRGAAAGESQVFLDRIPVPFMFHFGGLTSFMASRLVESLRGDADHARLERRGAKRQSRAFRLDRDPLHLSLRGSAMNFAPVSRGHAVVATALGLALASPALAAETGSKADATPTASASAQPKGPLLVCIDGQAEGFDKASLQAALSRELGRNVTLTDDAAAAAVQIRLDGAARADVRYTTPGGEQLSRTVDLPPDRKRAVQVVSWLTVNLVRDEATELLDELRARRKEEAAARAAAEQAAQDKAAADKAAADKTAADKAASDKAAAEAARQKAAREAQQKPAEDELLRDPLRSFDAAVATPLSWLSDSPRRELHLQLALGYGESGALDGIGISLGVLRVRRNLLGAASGVGATFVGGNARGVIASVGFSQLDGNLEGVQLAAGAAVQRGPLARGAVISVGGAVAGDLTGALVGAGFATSKSLHGVGISVGATVIRGPSEGVLIAGGANSSAAHRGIELAAGINTARDLQGFAIAPINVHRRVKGLQFGIVNVAEEVDAAIGVISIAKNGRVQPLLWTSTDGSAHLAIKSIAGYVFTQIGGGINLSTEQISYDGGMGAHLRLGKSFFLEPGVHYSALLDTADASGGPDEQQLHYVAQLGLRVGNKLDLLLAVGARHTLAGGSGAAFAPEGRAGIAFF